MSLQTKFQAEMDRTGTDVGQITCWCITIALHQEFGVGRSRLDKIAERMNVLEDENCAIMMSEGTRKADEARIARLKSICDPQFHVPLLRAPRGRKEQQYRIAGDNAASVAWQLYAQACIDVLGFGSQRLGRLKKLSWDNYAQFNDWAHEDMTWALDKLRRCAEDAMKEELTVMMDDSDEQSNEIARELRRMENSKRSLEIASEISRSLRANPVVMQSADKEAVIENIRKTIESYYGIGYLRR